MTERLGDEGKGRYRQLSGYWRVISLILPASAMAIIFVYVFHIRIFFMVDLACLYLLLGVLLPLCFIWIPAARSSDKTKLPWYDILLALLSFAIPIYFFLHARDVPTQGWATAAPPVAMILAAVFWPVLVEASRRSAGLALAIVILFFSLYPLFAEVMPGPLQSMPFTITKVIPFHIFSNSSAVGMIWRVSALLFAAYVIFAVFIKHLGANKFFIDIAISLLGRTRGCYAKVAIITSSLFGSISGSSVSNVVTTGVFTIPAMKKEGFSPEYAGAVEACASTGGTLMPPIMGAVAFVMAEFLAVSYVQIVVVAIVPSILYYLALFAQVDAYSARIGMKPPAMASIPRISAVLLDNIHIVLGMTVLVLVLIWLRLERWAPWFGMATSIGCAMLRKKSRPGLRVFRDFLSETGRTLGELTGILAPIGLILGGLFMTGVSFSFPYAFVSLAGGNVYMMLILGAAASFVLGMGITVTACYIFLSVIVAPGLVAGGFDEIASHLFVLYCALMSFITPPVALASLAAANIANASSLKTSLRAMRLGIGIFLVPFLFVLNPAMILRGPVLEIIQVVGTAAIGLTLLGAGIEGYLWRVGELRKLVRVLIIVAAVLLAFPNTLTDMIGAGILVATICGFLVMRRLA